MGMAASQARIGFLVSRKADITYDLQNLSMQKTSLARDMQKVTREYRAALSSKTLKFSNNGGITYQDLSYSTLMYPNDVNHNKPYLITNANGRVMVDSKYKKYAEMISPNGNPGGDYQSHRSEILSELAGVSVEDLENDKQTSEAVAQTQAKYDAIEKDKPKEPVESKTPRQFLEKTPKLSINGKEVNLAEKCTADTGNCTIDIGSGSAAVTNAEAVINAIVKTLSTSLSNEDLKNVEANKESVLQQCKSIIESTSENDYTSGMVQKKAGEKKDCKLDVLEVFSALMANCRKVNDSNRNENYNREYYYADRSENGAYTQYEKQYAEWQNNLTVAKLSLDKAKDSNDKIFTADKESTINYYDKLFQAIVDNGWSYEAEIEDPEFLNQSFQNNKYFITTMDSPSECGCEGYDYITDIATTSPNIFKVNNKDVESEAIAKYEHDKALITEKESRIDVRMKNLETEQSAIENMIKGNEAIRNDNIEKLNVFS